MYDSYPPDYRGYLDYPEEKQLKTLNIDTMMSKEMQDFLNEDKDKQSLTTPTPADKEYRKFVIGLLIFIVAILIAVVVLF